VHLEDKVMAQPLAVDIVGLAALLSVRPTVVREMVAAGQLPQPISINGERRWLMRDIRRWLDARRETVGA